MYAAGVRRTRSGLRKIGTTAKHLGPPGNSPENGVGTDAFGFADLEVAMNHNSSLASVYKFGDPRRIFGQGTSKQVMYLMAECWEHCAPSPDRIKEDILRWPKVCKMIIEKLGAVVPDIDFRSGRRVLRIDGKQGAQGYRTSKLHSRDRISTLDQELTVHLRLQEAVQLLLGPAVVVVAAASI
jgi:hypothetical protein